MTDISDTTTKILEDARALLDGGKAWTKEHEARNADDQPCSAGSYEAAKWCVLGALSKAAFERGGSFIAARDQLASFTLADHGLDDWNDWSEWPDIDAALVSAIADLKSWTPLETMARAAARDFWERDQPVVQTDFETFWDDWGDHYMTGQRAAVEALLQPDELERMGPGKPWADTLRALLGEKS